MITWRRARGHRDGQVITAYEGAAESVEYLIESRYALLGGREYRTFRIVGGRPVPAGDSWPTLGKAKAHAERDLEQVLTDRQAGAR